MIKKIAFISVLSILVLIFYFIENNAPLTLETGILQKTPIIPQVINLEKFDKPVQKQFLQRYQYIDLIKSQVDNDQKLGWAVGQLGKLFHAYSKLESAIDCYIIAKSLDVDSHQWPYLLAHIYKLNGEKELALNYFNQSLDLGGSINAFIWIAEIYYEMNNYEKSKIYFNTALTKDPKHPIALIGLSKIDMQLENNELALTRLLELHKRQAKSFQINYLIGQIYGQLGEIDKAKTFLNKVPNDSMQRISVDYQDPLMQEISDLRISSQSLVRKGRKALAQGYNQMAIKYFIQAVEANDTRIDTKYNLALAYFKTGETSIAKVHLLSIDDKKHQLTYYLLANIFEQENNVEAAIEYLVKANRITPNSIISNLKLANFYFKYNYHNQAEKYYRMVLEIDPENKRALNQLKSYSL
jgi:tetratricopeptide (TPR) repeat protein